MEPVNKKMVPVRVYKSKILDDLMKDISEETKQHVKEQMDKIANTPFIEHEDWFERRWLNYGQKYVKILKDAGYNPIAWCVMMCEDTFVFETDEEATMAMEQFQNRSAGENMIDGWWYGKAEFFPITVDKYESDVGYKLRIKLL